MSLFHRVRQIENIIDFNIFNQNLCLQLVYGLNWISKCEVNNWKKKKRGKKLRKSDLLNPFSPYTFSDSIRWTCIYIKLVKAFQNQLTRLVYLIDDLFFNQSNDLTKTRLKCYLVLNFASTKFDRQLQWYRIFSVSFIVYFSNRPTSSFLKWNQNQT